MRYILTLMLACVPVMESASVQNAGAPSLPLILKKTADRYKALTTYEINAKTTYVITRGSQSGSAEKRTKLAVGTQGQSFVEQDDNGKEEIRLSDGKNTWKALPKQKLWSKQEVAQAIDTGENDDDMSASNMGQDLFTQTQLSFVRRYTGLDRYVGVAQLDHEVKLKLNGEKIDCVVVHIPGKESDNRLFIAADSGLVIRHVEVVQQKTGQAKITTDYTSIQTEPPAASLFAYEPTNGSKQVNDLALPSERNVSLVGQRAADFTLTSLDGSPVHLADLQGKVVLLDFWATWCPPCRHELPTIEALSRKYKDKDVMILGINNEDPKTARRFLEQHHPDLATLHDEKAKVQRMYSCYAIPTVMVIDRDGKIVADFVGERSEGELVAALKQAGMR